MCARMRKQEQHEAYAHMTTALINNMQAAVDAIARSQHPTNKVAAAITGNAPDNAPFLISKANYWPPAIETAFEHNKKIGNSSGTIHAETACILAAPQTEGADIFITDPPCPNCMKNIAEAGIKNIYIDHKGFNKDFAKRRGHHFENMSMRICEKAGINLFEINRKDKTIIPILEIQNTYRPSNESPTLIKKEPNIHIYDQRVSEYKTHFNTKNFALCLAKNHKGEITSIAATKHATIGYTAATLESKHDKYSFILEPVNRLLMNAARHGLNILPETLYSSHTPTSREFVNLIGAELNTISIGEPDKSRDKFGPIALKQLSHYKILTLEYK